MEVLYSSQDEVTLQPVDHDAQEAYGKNKNSVPSATQQKEWIC